MPSQKITERMISRVRSASKHVDRPARQDLNKQPKRTRHRAAHQRTA